MGRGKVLVAIFKNAATAFCHPPIYGRRQERLLPFPQGSGQELWPPAFPWAGGHSIPHRRSHPTTIILADERRQDLGMERIRGGGQSPHRLDEDRGAARPGAVPFSIRRGGSLRLRLGPAPPNPGVTALTSCRSQSVGSFSGG